jgi:hypothetical protein
MLEQLRLCFWQHATSGSVLGKEPMVTYGPELTRPDLLVPLSPRHGLSLLVRRYLLGLHFPNFTRAYRVTLATAMAAAAVAVASLLVRSRWQGAVLDCSALIGLYAIVRALALVVLERGQRDFERDWMAAQSEVLRGHMFEVLRFAVQDFTDDGEGARRTYDLTRPAEVRDLLQRQNRERASGRLSRATVEFTYPIGDGALAVAEVHRELRELRFLEGRAGPGRAWIRFPGARYLARPGPGGHPAQRTRWALSGPVMIAVSESAYGGAPGLARAPGVPAGSREPGSPR